jgi:putative GTP pyrophosphokinase
MLRELCLDEFDQLAPALLTQGKALTGQLRAWLGSEAGIKVHSVRMRVKERASLARKLARPDRTYGALSDVTDLLGIRIITYFDEDVNLVAEVIEKRLAVDFRNSVDKRTFGAQQAFGYRSLHYVCALPEAIAAEDPKVPHAYRFEVQVRTMLEHAWAEIEHDLGYKAEAAVPVAVRRRLQRLAGLLELADQEFSTIREEISQYAAALPARLASREDNIALDQLSLQALLDCEEAREVDASVAAVLGKSLSHETFFPQYLLKMLAAGGISTVAAARKGLAQERSRIVAMVRPYFSFASSAWSLSPERMDKLVRGYSLFFLAHVQVLGAQSLGINKVDRLTRLYQALDYPNDEASAQKVASQLVEAFRHVL